MKDTLEFVPQISFLDLLTENLIDLEPVLFSFPFGQSVKWTSFNFRFKIRKTCEFSSPSLSVFSSSLVDSEVETFSFYFLLAKLSS